MSLKLNRETGLFEMTITINVDRGSLLRKLVSYIEKENVDFTNLLEYQKALEKVSSLYEWQGDPNISVSQGRDIQMLESNTQTNKEDKEKRQGFYKDDYPSTDKGEFIKRLIETPEKDWESLKTPIPEGYHKQYGIHGRRYYNREMESKIIRQFRDGKFDDMKLASMEKLQVVASATNGTRHK